MKKILLSFLSLFLFFMVWGEVKLNGDLTYETGILDGQINEYVFYKTDENDIRKLSQLDWELFHIPYVGLNVRLGTSNGFSASGGLKVGFPKESLVMQDYDWLNCIVHPEDDWLTNYSIHHNFLDGYLNLTVIASWKINLPLGLYIRPEFYIEQEQFSFYAKGGYKNYGKSLPDDDSFHGRYHRKPCEKTRTGNPDDDFDPDEKIITYRQNRYYTGGGLIFGWCISDFDFNLGVKICYADVMAEDHHLDKLKQMKYTDFANGFGNYEAGGNIFWKIDKRNRLGFSAWYSYLTLMMGPDYSASENSEDWEIDNRFLGGVSGSFIKCSVSYSFMF